MKATAGQTGTKDAVTVWFQLWRIGSDPAAAVNANGNAYTYYVTEVDADGNDWTPVNFEKEEDGMKVTNTYVSPTAGQTGTKEWAPPDLLDEYKVTVWFQLWRYIGSDPAAAVKVGDPVAITAPWTYTWAGMPTHDANGNAYTYYVTEVDADGNDWTPVNFEKEEDGMKVTNTYVSPTAGQTGTKEWAPPDLLDEYKVTVWFQLWRYIGSDPAAAVKVGDPVAITAPWTYTWAGMPTHDANGNAYTYYVTEVDADGNDWTPVNFEKEEDGMKVTNTYQSPTTNRTGTKVWMPVDLDPSLKVPVTLQLWRQIVGGQAELVATGDVDGVVDNSCGATGCEETPWNYTWYAMPTHDANGYEYSYWVDEASVPTDFVKSLDSMTVTNTYQSPTTNRTGTKVWMPVDLDPSLKVPVTLQLWRQIAGGQAELVTTGDVDGVVDDPCGASGCEETPWNYTWYDMPTHDANAHEYTYYVKEAGEVNGEIKLEGKTFTVTYNQDNLEVTNCYQIPKINLFVKKIWVGGPIPKPRIKVQLYRDGVPYGRPVRIHYPNTAYTWKNLDKTDINGVPYHYTVDELEVPAGYTKSVDGMIITNTYGGVPYTGDANSALLYGILAISSLAGFGAIVVGKCRKKK